MPLRAPQVSGAFKKRASGPRGRFLAEIRIRYSIFPSNVKNDYLLFPFSGQIGKIVKLSPPIRAIFASLLEVSTFRPTA